jgi:protein N-terminal methyltransferase
MSSLLANDSNLDDLVGTLMSQLRASPPDWLATSAKDESTALAQNTFAELAASQKVPNFSAKTAEHWLQVAQTSQTAKEWYTKAEDWWSDPSKAPATVGGVLGGFAELDPIDVVESSQFLTDINMLLGIAATSSSDATRALDGGAGIGRVAKHLLSEFYTKVDLVEGNQRLLDAAPEYMKQVGSNSMDATDKSTHLGERYCAALQDFAPEHSSYDCIWVQWVIIYLTDVDLVQFLKRCATGLKKKKGFIVIKENVLQKKYNTTEFVVDEEDSSLTRSVPYMKWIFEQAGLDVFIETKQENWDKSMLPVMMYCLRPKKDDLKDGGEEK